MWMWVSTDESLTESKTEQRIWIYSARRSLVSSRFLFAVVANASSPMDFESERGLYHCAINLCLLDQSERGLYLTVDYALCLCAWTVVLFYMLFLMLYVLCPLGQWEFNIPPTDSTTVLQGLQCIAAMIGANLSKPTLIMTTSHIAGKLLSIYYVARV